MASDDNPDTRTLMPLPTCRWRRKATIEGHHRCDSLKLRHGPNGVRDDLCQTCYVRDHRHPPATEVVRLRLLRLGISWPNYRAYVYRVGVFLLALLRHALAGFPRATDAEYAVRDAVCGPCFWRDRKTDSCSKCGCNLGGVKRLPNKKRMARERCPLWDREKNPAGQAPKMYWGPVKGETIFRRLWRRFVGRIVSGAK